MSAVLVTGSAGFFGGVLRDRLLADGMDVVGVDLEPDWARHPRLRSLQGDICDRRYLEEMVREGIGDRVLFGTDYPWFDQRSHLLGAFLADIPTEDRRAILRDNALRVFALE